MSIFDKIVTFDCFSCDFFLLIMMKVESRERSGSQSKSEGPASFDSSCINDKVASKNLLICS